MHCSKAILQLKERYHLEEKTKGNMNSKGLYEDDSVVVTHDSLRNFAPSWVI